MFFFYMKLLLREMFYRYCIYVYTYMKNCALLLNLYLYRCSAIFSTLFILKQKFAFTFHRFISNGKATCREAFEITNILYVMYHIKVCNRPASPSWFSLLVLVDYMHGTRRRRLSMSLSDFFQVSCQYQVYTHIQWQRGSELGLALGTCIDDGKCDTCTLNLRQVIRSGIAQSHLGTLTSGSATVLGPQSHIIQYKEKEVKINGCNSNTVDFSLQINVC